ncbi:N-acetyltransferase [Nocardia sp. BSTN01]|uniref:peptidogalycan biosysnthesis protein n=1 Tax=Nocardia sp. BSTN01 TaxID=2783665 RepID=UPI00188FB67A|nr:peptidogalycan biosysnthesis protein [Nocardia sp. BSTN01]MBF5000395.1 N-acetyltransferase [Nocardia sp. BSTN01]
MTTDAVESIAAAEWDSLVRPGDLFQSHAWLRHLDDVIAPHSAVVVRRAGHLVAAMPVWEGDRSDPGLFNLPAFFPDMPELGRASFLWAGARRSVRNGLLCEMGPQRPAALSELLSGALACAHDAGHDGVIVPYLPVNAAVELAAAHRNAHCLVHSADATVYMSPNHAAEPNWYASGHNRKRRRRELRDFVATGHTLEWTDLTPAVAAEVAPLIANTRGKYGSSGGAAWINRIFEAQRKFGLDEFATVLLCRRNGALVSVAVCYRHADSLHGRYYGADESAGRIGSSYFVTTCHAPVGYAAQHGLRRVYLSTSSLEAKVRRGAMVEPLAAVVLLARGRLYSGSVCAHNRKLASEYLDRFSDYSYLLSPAWLDFLI